MLFFSIVSFFVVMYLLFSLLKSNHKKAIYHHKKSILFAEKGDYEKAKLHLEISKFYREKSKK